MSPMIANHRIQFPAGVLGLAVLVSFTSAHAAELDWTTVDADRQEVDMYVPGMSTWRPGYGKRIFGDRYAGTGVMYHTKWGGLLGDRPTAFLTHQKMRKRFRYHRLTELIQFFMGTSYASKPEVLSLKADTSEHGGFKYLKFDIQTSGKIRSCVGFLRLSTGNKEFAYGHYCLPNEGEITFKTISQIIDSITIHGTASEPDQNVLEQRLQKMQTVNERDDKNVCALGLTDNREAPSWDNRTRWRKYADEAKRRDFTPQSCAKLLGWKVELFEKDTPSRQIDSGSYALRRPIAVQWDGFDGPIAGYVQITGDGKLEKIKLTLPGSLGECTGKAEYKTRNSGLWFIKCGNGKSASGAFLAHGSGKGSSGDGYDNNGRKVKFTISGE